MDVLHDKPATAFGKRIAPPSTLVKGDAATRPKQFISANDDRQLIPGVQRRFLFDTIGDAAHDTKHRIFHGDAPPLEDFNDVVDMDDNRAETIVSQELCRMFLESTTFRFVILALIVINAILIGIQTDEKLTVDYYYLLTIFDQFVLTVFICELILKWYYGFWVFWRVGWNVLDFVIILALLIGPTALTFLGSSRILRILRVFRAFRSIRSVGALAGLSTVVQTILQSIPDMANIVLLLFIILLVFAVMGVTLFGKQLDNHFGDLITALFSLFIFVTQDGWVGIFEDFKDKDQIVYVIGALFCFMCILLGAFVFANLMVAVVVTNLECAMREIKTEQKAQADVLAVGKKISDPSLHELLSNKHVEVVPDYKAREGFDFSQQKPVTLANISHVPIEGLVNYYVILNAFEENLAEYKTLRDDLDKIADVVMNVNFGGTRDEDDAYMEYLKHSNKHPSDATLPAADKFLKGDILSNLIRMKTSNISGFERRARRKSMACQGKTGFEEIIASAARDLMHMPDKSSSKKQVNAKLLKSLGKTISEDEETGKGGGRRSTLQNEVMKAIRRVSIHPQEHDKKPSTIKKSNKKT